MRTGKKKNFYSPGVLQKKNVLFGFVRKKELFLSFAFIKKTVLQRIIFSGQK